MNNCDKYKINKSLPLLQFEAIIICISIYNSVDMLVDEYLNNKYISNLVQEKFFTLRNTILILFKLMKTK